MIIKVFDNLSTHAYLSKLTPFFSIILPHWHAHRILFSRLTCLFTCPRNHQVLSHHPALLLFFPQPCMAPFPTSPLPIQILYLLQSQVQRHGNPFSRKQYGRLQRPPDGLGVTFVGAGARSEWATFARWEKRNFIKREVCLCRDIWSWF